MCGEKNFQIVIPIRAVGSPPRVRGKVCKGTAAFWAIGITPACAGKRECIKYRRSTIMDHPRVCGEKHAVRNALATL